MATEEAAGAEAMAVVEAGAAEGTVDAADGEVADMAAEDGAEDMGVADGEVATAEGVVVGASNRGVTWAKCSLS